MADLATVEVDAPEEYVAKHAFFGEHPAGDRFLKAHPPARIGCRADLRQHRFLTLSLAVHPIEYPREGGGVRFLVRVEGEVVLDFVVDPTRDPAQRGWKRVSLDLARFWGPGQQVELITEVADPERPHYLTAGWGRPTLSRHPLAHPPEHADFVGGRG